MSPSKTPKARFQMRMRGCETVNAQPPRGAGAAGDHLVDAADLAGLDRRDKGRRHDWHAQIEVQGGLVEVLGVEAAGLHHVDGALEMMRLVFERR